MKRTLLLAAAIALMLAILHTFGLTTNTHAIITYITIFVFQSVVIVAVIGKPKNSNVIILSGLLALVLFSVMAAHLVLFYLGNTGGIVLTSGIVAMFSSVPLILTFLYLGQYRR